MVMRGVKGFWATLTLDANFRIMIIVASSIWIYTSLTKVPFVVPSHYSDVGWLWIRDVYQGHHELAIPYVDYELEYPQMIGLLIYMGQAISHYFPFLIDSYNTFVAVEGLLEYPFMIGTIYNLYALCKKLGLDTMRIYLFMLTTLTFIVYGFYNWDIVVAYFTTLTIWYFLEQRYDASALALVAGTLTKFIPGIVMILPITYSLPGWKARARFLSIAAGSWGLVNLPFALAPNSKWLLLFVGTSGPVHQLQNTWISMAISVSGLGDIISGAKAGWILSYGLILYLLIRASASKRTPLEKILLSWYAWYGVIYLFDPQMFIQLMPIIVLTPNFNFLTYRIADALNAFIILFYFIGSSHPELPSYITDQLTPFGLTNMEAAIRQIIVLSAYFVCFNPRLQERLKRLRRTLSSPFPTREEPGSSSAT
jgi:hypothetical protein